MRGGLTCESAGAHGERRAWRRHCRAGAAKERAASMMTVNKVMWLPDWSYTQNCSERGRRAWGWGVDRASAAWSFLYAKRNRGRLRQASLCRLRHGTLELPVSVNRRQPQQQQQQQQQQERWHPATRIFFLPSLSHGGRLYGTTLGIRAASRVVDCSTDTAFDL